MGLSLGRRFRTPTVAVADNIPEDAPREPPEFAGKYDPHIDGPIRVRVGAAEHLFGRPLAARINVAPLSRG